jgi:hypothetical protein
VEAIVERRATWRRQLEEALEEREIAQERFEASIGTSTEMHAYQRLRSATRHLTAADSAARQATGETAALRA